jgi:hypothetical protein
MLLIGSIALMAIGRYVYRLQGAVSAFRKAVKAWRTSLKSKI